MSSYTFNIMCILCIATTSLFAKREQIHIRIEGFSDKKAPIAIVPFIPQSINHIDPMAKDIEKIIANNLKLTGWVHIIDPKAFLGKPLLEGFDSKTIPFKNWRAINALYLIKGWYEIKDKKLRVKMFLFDVTQGKLIESTTYKGELKANRVIAHRFSNLVVEVLTGQAGIFTSKIAAIEVKHHTISKPKKGSHQQVRVSKNIVVMDFDGYNLKHITTSQNRNMSPTWSKDGTKIAYTCNNKNFWEVCVADFTKGTLRSITDKKTTITAPRFSPIEDILALTIVSEKKDEIYLMDLNGKILRELTSTWGIDISPAWSPDGKQIAFSSDRTGRLQIYLMDSTGKNEKRILFDGKRNTSPSWSPKGDKIAFAGYDTDGDFDIFIMSPNGTEIERLTYDSGSNEYPTWSPDGRFIAFSSTRTGGQQIYIMNKDGSNQRQLTKTTQNVEYQSPSWSPILH